MYQPGYTVCTVHCIACSKNEGYVSVSVTLVPLWGGGGGARNQVGIGLSYRPASLCTVAWLLNSRLGSWNRFLAPQRDLSFRLWIHYLDFIIHGVKCRLHVSYSYIVNGVRCLFLDVHYIFRSSFRSQFKIYGQRSRHSYKKYYPVDLCVFARSR